MRARPRSTFYDLLITKILFYRSKSTLRNIHYNLIMMRYTKNIGDEKMCYIVDLCKMKFDISI